MASEPEGLGRAGEAWTFEGVQQRLAEAHGFERRLPGGGGSPFAADGPWHLVIRERADLAEQQLAGHEVTHVGRGALRTAEVERMLIAIGWLDVVLPANRRLVWAVAGELAAWGERPNPAVNWARVAACDVRLTTRTGARMGPEPLQMRYRRSIERIVRALNRGFPGTCAVKA